MSRLKELERRLREEPENLGLRVMVAGALHEAGRRDDAVEIYRSVAIAYRDQGRSQQAISVCRSILELAPDDAPCRALLDALLAGQPAPRASPPPAPRDSPSPPPPPSPHDLPSRRAAPVAVRPTPSRLPLPPEAAEIEVAEMNKPIRRSSGKVTPLPLPLPYHDADPTTGSLQRLSPSDLPPSLQAELASYPEIAGIAAAARQISASLIAATRQQQEEEELDELDELGDDDLAAELDTGRLLRTGGPRATPSASVPPPLPRAPSPSPTTEVMEPPGTAGGDDDEPTLPPPPSAGAVPQVGGLEDEKTLPRELPARARAPSTTATGPLTGAFFAPLPARNRAAVLQRFRRRMATAGTTLIRRGETGHGLFIVVRGRLELHVDRPDGVRIALGAVAPGEFIGEASLLARAPAAAHVVAAAHSELLVLAPDDFHEVTRAFPALRAELESVAARRARDHQQRGVP